ncbi:MAG TPA: hypothetical protein VHE33_08835 [Acidobacteriaceae bacterium]|nr:hypothetical protein [Acidobacteriaceae bacterium]
MHESLLMCVSPWVVLLLTGETGSAAKVFWLTIGLTAIPGILGGLTYGVSVYLKAVDARDDKWPPSGRLSGSVYFMAQGASGLGGAIAALLVILWAKRFPDNLSDGVSLLNLAALAFVAGFAANRLLPMIADSVSNQLSKLIQKTDETATKADAAKEAVQRAEAKVKQATDLATVLVRASDYLRSKSFIPKQTADLLTTLETLNKEFPTNRTLNILLARMYDEAAGKRAKAVEILKGFIDGKVKAGEGKDTDVAAAWWNIANYHEFDFTTAKTPALRASALEALDHALAIDKHTYYEKLTTDDDFKDLVASPEGQKLLSAYKP